MATINLIANDIPGSFPIDPASIVLSNVDPTLSVINNGDGTVDVAGDTIGQFTFEYTVADTSANVSPAAVVTVTVQPVPVAADSVAGLVQWFDATTLPVLTDATAMPTLTAVVGNDGVAGAVTSIPEYRTVAFNGHPCIHFLGNTNSRYDFSDPFGSVLSDYTAIFAVSVLDEDQQGVVLSNRLGTGGGGAVMFVDTTSSQFTNLFTYPSSNNLYGTGLDENDIAVVAMRRNAAGKQVYLDLVEVSSSAVMDDLTNNDWKLGGEPLVGGNWNLSGLVAEVAMYGVALNDVDMLNVIKGMKDKYGI